MPSLHMSASLPLQMCSQAATTRTMLGEMMRMFMLCNVQLAFPRVCYAGQIKEIGLHYPGPWPSHQPTFMQHVNKLHDHHRIIITTYTHNTKCMSQVIYEEFTASLCETMCVQHHRIVQIAVARYLVRWRSSVDGCSIAYNYVRVRKGTWKIRSVMLSLLQV